MNTYMQKFINDVISGLPNVPGERLPDGSIHFTNPDRAKTAVLLDFEDGVQVQEISPGQATWDGSKSFPIPGSGPTEVVNAIKTILGIEPLLEDV